MADEITVYGSSDDLIEVEGCIREEFPIARSYDGENGNLLAFSNGVVLRIRYEEDGIWRITPLAGADLVRIEHPYAVNPEDDAYSDRAMICVLAEWVVHGGAWAKAGR